FICSAVVLGLSATLAKQQLVGPVPPEIGFSSFAGAFAMVACLVGVAGLWVNSIPGVVTMAMDGIAAVVYLVGGIILTSALKVVSSCSAISDEAQISIGSNKLLTVGCTTANYGSNPSCSELQVDDPKKDPSISRCQRAVTDYAFDYFGFTLYVAMVFLGYVLARRGGSRPTVAAQI
ncbi:hypothetical protein PG994_012440, partial [Apiospora phragmitis]